MNISHSKIELYNACPFKYYLKYVEKYEPDKTYSALLFGISLDKALNYILTRKKRNHLIYQETAKLIFKKTMKMWNGQNEFVFFKNEAPYDISDLDSKDQQWIVWQHLISIGEKMIETYINEVLPLFLKILSVQTKRRIKNEAGDSLILITDFTAQLQDGRIVVMDNKTSSDIKKYYGKNSVKNSQQLAIYSEFEQNKLAGYVALQKKPINNKIQWIHIVDEISEEKTKEVFQKIDDTLNSIKNNEFSKNTKNCRQYGRICEYYNLCHYGNEDGLLKK